MAQNQDKRLGAATLTGLGARSAEKQPPSALQYMAEMQKAMAAEKALTSRPSNLKPKLARESLVNVLEAPTFREDVRKITSRELLGKCIADYNKLVTVKKWRIDSGKRKLISNLMDVGPEFRTALARHYDFYPHSTSGLGWAERCRETPCFVVSLLLLLQLHLALYRSLVYWLNLAGFSWSFKLF